MGSPNVSDICGMFSNSSFNQDISSWDISNIFNIGDMLLNSTNFSIKNYDKLLVAWSSLNLKTNNTFDISTKYCDAVSRQKIIDNFGWKINETGRASALECQSLSINEERILETNIHPNTTKNLLNINIEYDSIYEIFTVLGQQVAQGYLQTGKNTISLSKLTNGIYFINLNTGNKSIKFVKN